MSNSGYFLCQNFEILLIQQVNKLHLESNIIIIHVPNNHTNLFRQLDISFNKSAKCFLSTKYQDWYAEKVLEHLNRGINAHDVKMGIRLSTIKPLHAKWIVDVFKFMKESKDLIIFGFSKTHISEAAAESGTLMNLCENAYQEIELIVDTAI